MKKLSLLSVTMLLALAACGGNTTSSNTSIDTSSEAEISSEIDSGASSKEESSLEPVDYSDLKIACPKGAPAIGLYDQLENSNVEINAVPDNVVAYIAPNSAYDVVIAPTNVLVSRVMTVGAPFKIAGVVTFGNFYLVSTGNDDNDTFDKDDYIVVFQEKGLPGKLFNYVYGSDYTNVHGVGSAELAKDVLLTGINSSDNNTTADYVLMAQPSIGPAMTKAKTDRAEVADKIKVIKDVQEDYKAKTNNAPLTQASIFIKDTNDASKKAKVNQLLVDLEAKITKLVNDFDNSGFEETVSSLEVTTIASKFGAPNYNVLKSAIKANNIHIGYQKAKDFKSEIDAFLMNLGFINEETSEEYYW